MRPCPFLPFFLEPSISIAISIFISMSMPLSMSMSMSIHCHKFAAFSTVSFTPSFSLQLPIQLLLLNGPTQQVIPSHPAYFQFYSEPHPGTRAEERGPAGLSLLTAMLLVPSAHGKGSCHLRASAREDLSLCRMAAAVVPSPNPGLPDTPWLLAVGQQVPG